jgi:hypothetical protein
LGQPNTLLAIKSGVFPPEGYKLGPKLGKNCKFVEKIIASRTFDDYYNRFGCKD